MIETASAYAEREMLPEARQALQRARSALSQRSDVGPAHWCNACLVALEIAARGGDVQAMESEAAQLRSLSGGGRYWSEQARARVGKSSGRIDLARLDRVFAILAGDALPSSSAAPPAAEPPPFRAPDIHPPAEEGMSRSLIAPTPRPVPPIGAPPAAAAAFEAPSAEVPAVPAPTASPAERYAAAPSASAPSPVDPRERTPEHLYRGAAWGGAAWMGSASHDPPADAAESISTSAPEDDFCFQEASTDEWMARLSDLADVADDNLPLIFTDFPTAPPTVDLAAPRGMGPAPLPLPSALPPPPAARDAAAEPLRPLERRSGAVLKGIGVVALVAGAVWMYLPVGMKAFLPSSIPGIALSPRGGSAADAEDALRGGNAERALEIARALPSDGDEAPRGHLVRGRALLATGDTAGAVDALAAAARADNRGGIAWAAAEALARLPGHEAPAAEAYLLAFAAGLPEARAETVARAQELAGRPDRARRVREQAASK
jgi:hypothetical protein